MDSPHHDIFFLHGSRTFDCRAVVDKYFDHYFSFQLITSGVLILEYDDRKILLEAPAVFTCFPGSKIKFQISSDSRSNWDHHYLAFRGSRVREWISSGLFFYGEQKLDSAELFLPIMQEAIDIFLEDGPWARERVSSRLEALLADLANLRGAKRRELWLNTYLSLIKPNQQPNYTELAKACHLSLPHLRRKFKDHIGLSLHEHWLDLRSREAGRLMTEGRHSLAHIAEQLGYHDASFFSRQFKQRMGISPKDYRKSLFPNEMSKEVLAQ